MLEGYDDLLTAEEACEVLKIGKNKDGEAGGIAYLVFDGAHQRFRESVVDAAVKTTRREPEYKQTAFYNLPGSVPVPFEEGGETP